MGGYLLGLGYIVCFYGCESQISRSIKENPHSFYGLMF